MSTIKIDIVSDAVCPWCYIGKKRLETGIEKFRASHPERNDTFEINWFPFYLNPYAPKQGVNKREYYKKRFGEEQAEAIFARLTAAGQPEGIDFKFGGLTGRTRDAHRVIHLGKSKSRETQTRVVEQLFKAYFEEEQDITSHDALQAAAVRAGLAEAEVRDVLASDAHGPEVDEEVSLANEKLVSGVPAFTIQDTFEVSGAQEPEAFAYLFDRVVTNGNA